MLNIEAKELVAVYSGSFDPITAGHLDIIRRASVFVDLLVVAVCKNSEKAEFFSIEERLALARELTEDMKNVQVGYFSGLLADYVKVLGANLIIRGVRGVNDLEYENQIAAVNRHLTGGVDTVFIPASQAYLYISSSIVREMVKYGGDYDAMVPPLIKEAIIKKHPKK